MICNIGVKDRILEGEGVNSTSLNRSSLGPLFEEIKVILKCFHKIEVQHASRVENAVTHKLARHVQLVDDIALWW